MSTKHLQSEVRKNYLAKRNELLLALRHRDGDICNRCQKYLPVKKMTIDHIKSIKNGGKNIKKNLQILCYDCNQGKGSKSVHPKDIISTRSVSSLLKQVEKENNSSLKTQHSSKIMVKIAIFLAIFKKLSPTKLLSP